MRMLGRRTGTGLAVVAGAGLLLGSYLDNEQRYFVDYNASYIDNSVPYSDAGAVMRGFAEFVGGYGNVFVINYPYWWGHRELGEAAGDPNFINGVYELNIAPQFLRDGLLRNPEDPYHLDAERDVLFFFAPQDAETLAWLQAVFPTGVYTEMATYQPDNSYMLFRVPPLGQQGMLDAVEAGERLLEAAGEAAAASG
jgi:hypothetical protein